MDLTDEPEQERKRIGVMAAFCARFKGHAFSEPTAATSVGTSGRRGHREWSLLR